MDLKNIFETGKPHTKKQVMINHEYNTIRVSYEGFRVELSLTSNCPYTVLNRNSRTGFTQKIKTP
jgi:hypothetical protein